jgi:exosortase H (IPTLxxWG-CTERM-specific)
MINMGRIGFDALLHLKKPSRFDATPRTWFCVLFLLYSLITFGLLEVAPDSFYYPINRLNAVLTGSLLSLLGMAPEVNGLYIVLEGFKARVVGECSAVFISVIPFAFIMAYPSQWQYKCMGWTLSMSILFCINLARIAFLIFTGARAPENFDQAHLFLGQTIMILVVLGICLGWVYWLHHKPNGRDLINALGRAIAISMAGLCVWLWISEPYSYMLYTILKSLLTVVDIDVLIPRQLHIYPDTFQCFNWVTFSALFWALGFGYAKRRIIQWLSGLAIMSICHLIFKFLQVLFFQLNQHYLMGAINVMLVLNEWLLPFGLWLLFVRRALLPGVSLSHISQR